jgi:DNA-binding protein HU-beta
MAARLKVSLKEATKALDTTIHIVKHTLKEEKKVVLMGFGTFGMRHRKSRDGHNPQTRATIQIQEKQIPRFHPGRQFVELLNKK